MKQTEALYINDIQASTKGVWMGDGFLNTLEQPVTLKDYVSNESRLLDGKQVIVKNKRIASRSLTLTFNIHGENAQQYNQNKQWLFEQLTCGYVKLKVKNAFGEEKYYHLIYNGKSVSYGELYTHMDGKQTCGFDEPNPAYHGNDAAEIGKFIVLPKEDEP